MVRVAVICYAPAMRFLSSHTGSIGVVLALSFVAIGCNRGAARSASPEDVNVEPSVGEEQPPQPPAEGWPRVMVIGPGTGPGLFAGAQSNAPAFGYVNPGVRIRIESAPQNGRIQVLLAGGLPVKAWLPADRVALYAQQRGRVTRTAYYVGPNDLVNVLGPDATPGQMRVSVRPWLGGTSFLEAQVGTIASEQLRDQPVDAATVEGPTAGECYVAPAGQELRVHDRIDGQVVATIPAQQSPVTMIVLRQQAPWYGVRIGYGPYVVGYVQGALTPCQGARPNPTPMAPVGDGTMPHWMRREQGTLYRVAAGTRVVFANRTVARLRGEGWARELGRPSGGENVDAFVAVDDQVAIRGLVPASALTPVEGASAPASAAPAAPPAPPVPPAPPGSELAD